MILVRGFFISFKFMAGLVKLRRPTRAIVKIQPAGVAQLVEHVLGKDGVPGSIPGSSFEN
jgi:hypothetical protein